MRPHRLDRRGRSGAYDPGGHGAGRGHSLTVRRQAPPVLLAAPTLSPHPEIGTLGLPGRVPSARSIGHAHSWAAFGVGTSSSSTWLGILAAAYLALALRYDSAIGTAIDSCRSSRSCSSSSPCASPPTCGSGCTAAGWRFASVPDLERIVAAVAAGSIVGLVVVYGASDVPGVTWASGLPRSFWLAEILISGAVLGGVRFGIRAASDWLPQAAPVAVTDRRATLFYGAGRTGVLMARSARRKPDAGVVPVGFLDDDPNLAGGLVANLRVFGGLEALDRAIDSTAAEALLITMPSATGQDDSTRRRRGDGAWPRRAHRSVGERSPRRHARCLSRPARPGRGPASANHGDRARGSRRTRSSATEPCSSRAPAGSIGSELARQVFSLGPRRLILVDRAESALYLIQRELEAKRDRDEGLGDASDASRERRQSTRDGPTHLRREARHHLPCRCVQARADDGGASRPTPST